MEITNVPVAFVAEFLFTFALAYVVAEFRDRERHARQLVLRPGHRYDGNDWRIFGWTRFLAERSIRQSPSARP